MRNKIVDNSIVMRLVIKSANKFSELKNISEARNAFHQFPYIEESSYALKKNPDNFMLHILYIYQESGRILYNSYF